MRVGIAWIVAFVCVGAIGTGTGQAQDMVEAQDLVPEESQMEARGAPPLKTPPDTVGEPDVRDATGGPAGLPVDPNLLGNAQLMNQLVIQSTQKTIRQQKFAAAAGITGGAILLGLGAWRLTETPPNNNFTRGLGVMFMTLGAADLTTGIFAATRVSHEKRRLERWEKLKADGVTELDLARMEGELQASSETRQGERLLVRWNGLTHALAGMVVIALSPISDSNTSRDKVVSYVVGGVFTATGFSAFGFSFRPTPTELAWKTYQEKKLTSATPKVSWRVTPGISLRGASLGVSGQF